MVARSASDIPVLLDPGLYSPEFWQDYYAQVVTQDDEPVDGPITEKQMRLLTHPLYTSWRTERPFVAHANVGLFFEPKRPPVVPDIMVVLDVRSLPFDEGKKAHAYFLWEYRKVPEVAIEVVSNDEGEEDGRKKNIYAAIGIPHYVVFDPEKWLGNEVLRTYELRGGGYEQVPEPWFPAMNLGMRIWHGWYEDFEFDYLRWSYRDGKVVPTAEELAATARKQAERHKSRADRESKRADEERQRAEEELRRAEDAAARARKAEERAERLAEKLRRLGIEPNGD